MDQNIVNDQIEGGGTARRKRWQGSVTKIMKSPCERIWKLSADFVNVNKIAKFIDKCEHVEGERNEIGCVRYCITGVQSPGEDEEMMWAKEKLLTMDPLNHCFTYSIIDGNLGIEGYVATFKLFSTPNQNCVVEWSFEADPSKYFEEEQFIRFISIHMEQIVESLDEIAESDESA